MYESEKAIEEIEATKPSISEIRRITRVMFSRWVVIAGAVIIVLLILVAIFAPLISPYDPNDIDLLHKLEHPSATHFLGTDDLGRDILSRIIYGSRISLLVGIVAVLTGGVVGMALGLVAGHFGGWTFTIIMRFIDALMALPPLILIMAIAAVLGGGLTNVLIALSIGMLPVYSRLMCGQVLTMKESDYVTAAYILGAGNMRIMLRHLVPNCLPPLLVLITINLGTAILMEASLSFLGIGIVPPTATWGAMTSAGYKFLMSNPIYSMAPGVCILLVVLAFNMVGDGLRDALDPRLRGVL
ncbi:MAG: ABC transporter permease [Dehalococcoidales bacterium]|nr:ABC transporter permease [Dehalococcoidales bacterium]